MFIYISDAAIAVSCILISPCIKTWNELTGALAAPGVMRKALWGVPFVATLPSGKLAQCQNG